jgi:predicted dehydrogenase/threonine dehydrogenase-like Zn-dependent dehydrogenase
VKQVAQRATDGRVSIETVPAPSARPGWVIVRNHYSVISAGTERAKIELGQKGLLAKARARPDLVRKTIERARVEGIAATVALARERLAALAPIGYSSAGVVESIGPGVEGFAPGDRVACGGAGWANHATVVSVPKNLVARVPPAVELNDAAYATIGAIALHGVRQADGRLGERIGVIGLGLVGQLTVRILVAAGCTAVGIDLDQEAVELAANGGARAFPRNTPGLERIVIADSVGGLDAVIICAAADSDDPLNLACHLLRDRGRVVIVGDVPVTASRAVLYEKEIELRLSRSYGPGRYDSEYEEHGRDLPVGYVRWTEQRNLQAFVDLIGDGKVAPSDLTTHRFPLDEAVEAYVAAVEPGVRPRPFGILLEYPTTVTPPVAGRPQRGPLQRSTGDRIGVIGAGAFATRAVLPYLAKAGVGRVAVASERGLSAADAVMRFGFERSATAEEIIADDGIDAIIIATRHGSHAALSAAALRAGKAVLVEKPLALNVDDLDAVCDALGGGGRLMVGFNRRYAPQTSEIVNLLAHGPHAMMTIRVNAGPLPDEHWLHDPQIGGGRLLGEGCHFIDLLMHCVGKPVASVHAVASPRGARALECSDDFAVSLRFQGGGIGTLLYTAEGATRMAKERIEAFANGRSVIIEDFRQLTRFDDNRRAVSKIRQDKGHNRQLAHFLSICRGEIEAPDPQSYVASTHATFAAAESLRTGNAVELS